MVCGGIHFCGMNFTQPVRQIARPSHIYFARQFLHKLFDTNFSVLVFGYVVAMSRSVKMPVMGKILVLICAVKTVFVVLF